MKVFGVNSLDEPERVAWYLGIGGLIPFCTAFLAIALGHGAVRQFAVQGLVTYGAVILTFVGAIHWGRAMFGTIGVAESKYSYVVSVIPSLLAWICLFFSPRPALLILAVSFALLFFYDRSRFAKRQDLRWYVSLRLRLTTTVVTVLLLSIWAL